MCVLNREPKSIVQLALLFILVCFSMGCDDSLVYIKGTVTLDGELLEGASVTFFRADIRGRPAAGVTDESGSFDLTSYQKGDGLPPGDYKVTITKVVDGEDFRTSSSLVEEKHRSAYKKAKPFNPQYPRLKRVLPEVYGSLKDTPLACTVPSTEELRFDLESSPAG